MSNTIATAAVVLLFLSSCPCQEPSSDCLRCAKLEIEDYRSYLDTPQIHFTGRVRADVLTINNNIQNFDVDNFHVVSEVIPQRSYARFNPRGTGAFDFYDTHVTGVCKKGGYCTTDDPIIGISVDTAVSSVSAKIIDVDSENIIATHLIGLTIGLDSYTHYPPVLTARVPTATFLGIHGPVSVDEPRGHIDDSGRLEAILEDVKWNDDILNTSEKYAFLRHLRDSSKGVLSFCITTYIYNSNPNHINNTYGYVVGTIGPGSRGPSIGRRNLQPSTAKPDRNNGNGQFEMKNNDDVIVDFSNVLLYRYKDGRFVLNTRDMGDKLCLETSASSLPVGVVELSDDWYKITAGIQRFRPSKEAVEALRSEYLNVLRCHDRSTFLVETKQYARSLSDLPVFMNPGDQRRMKLLATRYGYPICGHELPIEVFIAGKSVPEEKKASTLEALTVNGGNKVTVSTNCRGEAHVTFAASDPGNPRPFEDGCVYHVRFVAKKDDLTIDTKFSVRVFDPFPVEDKPTWYGQYGVYNIFKLYYYLVPVMRTAVNLADYNSVVAPRNIQYIKMSMTRPYDDPGFMPVTRDLSKNKTMTVLKWLDQYDPHLSSRPAKERMGSMSLEELRKQLQLATQVEHYTIPVYLYAYYSIKDGYNYEVKRIIRSIYIDEMLHMSLAANILNAIGGFPDFGSAHVIPVYPSRLPGDLHPELTLHLSPLSKHLIKDIFMHIEEPRYLQEGKEDLHAHTIGGFYMRIKKTLKKLEEEQKAKGSTIFTGDPARQVEYNLPGHLQIFKVSNLTDALKALELIVEQGEGSSQVMPRDEYDQLSHYYKFKEIVEGRRLVKTQNGKMRFKGAVVDFDPEAVYPLPENPHVKDYPAGSLARRNAETFSRLYLNLLYQLHRTFNGSPKKIVETFSSMFYLNMRAKELSAMEVIPGDPSVHAGPTFENPANL